MAKKLHNMTTDERIAYFEKEREKERIQRRHRVGKFSIEPSVTVIKGQ